MIHELICIRCPLGCGLRVDLDEKINEVISVTGNSCPLGHEYGKNEVVSPMRTVTSTVAVSGGELPLVSVKTAHDVPKAKINEVMAEIIKATVKAPVKIGDVIIKNAAGTGVDVIATRDISKKEGE